MRRALTALVLAAAASTAAAQSQAPVFRSGVTLVAVDVTVLDPDGKPVPGLTADDFQIKLNGKLQPVRALSYVQVARQAAGLTVRDIAPDVTGRQVVTNSAPAGEQKVFVLAIDDLSFPAHGGKRSIEGAKKFVAAQSPGVYIGLTTTSATTVVNPTLDRAALISALTKVTGAFVDPRRPMIGGGPTVGIAEAIEIIENNDATVLSNVLKRECGSTSASLDRTDLVIASKCATDTQSEARLITSTVRANTGRQVGALTAAVNAMKGAPGLKQLVVLSEGIGTTRDAAQILDPIGRAAAAAGVQLSVVMEDVDEMDLSDPGHVASETGVLQPDTGMSNRIREDKRMFRSSMQTLADITGGTFEYVVGQADKAFERVAVAGSAVYRIGVEAPSDATAAKPLVVTAAVRRPGLAVHVNRQAVLPGPAVQPSAAEQVTSAIKEGQAFFSVPIRLAVARRRASANQVQLGIGIEVPGAVKGPLTMTFGLVDEKGELRQGSRPLAAPASGADYRLTFSLPVAPGQYSLRFAVADADGSVGSVDTSIDAKLMTMGTLDASDVLTWWTDAAGKAQFLALDQIPAGVTSLGAGLELYPRPGASFPDDVSVKMSLVPAGKTEPVIEKDVTPRLGDNMWRAEAALPLAGVPAGTYVLKAAVTVAGKPVGEASALIKKN